MARLTSELASRKIGGQYDLVLVAARRTRELNRGWAPLVKCDNSLGVTALREIEAGLVGRDYLRKPQNLDRKERPPSEEK
jgi:DNA-directed RNA polymerase omega subunit